jgi:opacity protein-like surface antigen
VTALMSIVFQRSNFAFVVAALCLGGEAAHAQAVQATSMPSWAQGLSIGDWATGDQAANTFGNFAGVAGGGLGGRFSSRYNFENGWFVGSERGGLGLNGFGQASAFGGLGSLSYEGVQFGYNFKSAPVSVYAGFDTSKSNNSFGSGATLPGFDSPSSSDASGYRVNAGVEFRPTSNLSLSVGASFAQQPQATDTISQIGAPFAFGRR